MNGLFDFFSSSSDSDTGRTVLQAYFDEATKYPAFKFTDYDSWITWATTSLGGQNFQDLVGNLVNINYAATSVSDSADRVANLANQSGGTANLQSIVSAAGGNGNTVNWGAAIPEVTVNTLSDTAAYLTTAAGDIGTGVMGTLSLTKYLPWILGGAAVLYIYTIAKSSGGGIGRGFENLSKAGSDSLRKVSSAASDRIARKNPRRKRSRKSRA